MAYDEVKVLQFCCKTFTGYAIIISTPSLNLAELRKRFHEVQALESERTKPLGRYRRAVRISVSEEASTAEMCDDGHHFRVALKHDGARIVSLDSIYFRVPWANCPGAPAYLKTLEGSRLSELRQISPIDRSEHCTHLFDLALQAAARADMPGYVCEYRVEVDYDEEQPRLRFWRNGESLVESSLDGWTIRGSRFDGMEVSQLHLGAVETDRDALEAALILQRSCFMSRSRTMDLDAMANARVVTRSGHCYATQPVRESQAARIKGSRRDFWAEGIWPLEAPSAPPNNVV